MNLVVAGSVLVALVAVLLVELPPAVVNATASTDQGEPLDAFGGGALTFNSVDSVTQNFHHLKWALPQAM